MSFIKIGKMESSGWFSNLYGFIGLTMTIVMPEISALNGWLQLTGGLIGLVLMILAIKQKVLQNHELKLKIKKLEKK